MIKDIETSKRLRCLRPILKKWIKINCELGELWAKDKDAPWWYNERAHLSVFSGAVWETDGYAFEEYSELKGEKKLSFSGRIDLWFSVDKDEFCVEAKQCWPTIQRGIEYIRGFMEKAKKDVRKCRYDGFTKRLAVVFGSPKVEETLGPIERRERIQWLIARAKKVEHDAIAWVFPEFRKLPKDKNWIYPGIIVWIKEVRR